MSSHENGYNIAPSRASSTPKRHNDSSVIILLPPEKESHRPGFLLS